MHQPAQRAVELPVFTTMEQEEYELRGPLRCGGAELLAAGVAEHWRTRRARLAERAYEGLRVSAVSYPADVVYFGPLVHDCALCVI